MTLARLALWLRIAYERRRFGHIITARLLVS